MPLAIGRCNKRATVAPTARSVLQSRRFKCLGVRALCKTQRGRDDVLGSGPQRWLGPQARASCRRQRQHLQQAGSATGPTTGSRRHPLRGPSCGRLTRLLHLWRARCCGARPPRSLLARHHRAPRHATSLRTEPTAWPARSPTRLQTKAQPPPRSVAWRGRGGGLTAGETRAEAKRNTRAGSHHRPSAHAPTLVVFAHAAATPQPHAHAAGWRPARGARRLAARWLQRRARCAAP